MAFPVEFRDVTYIRGETRVLNGITARIEPGSPTVLVGPNGSGKTTFLRMAMGLLAPTGGQILWGGQPACPKARQAFVFQRPTMLRRTVIENVRYALRHGRGAGTPQNESQRVTELLTMVGLKNFGSRAARSLSGGEQQRVALARALGQDPDLLYLDEPTASLDPAATKIVEDMLQTLVNAGIKVVMSTHDLGEARRVAGDIIMLHRGRLIEHRSAGSFFSSPRSAEAASFLAGDLLL